MISANQKFHFAPMHFFAFKIQEKSYKIVPKNGNSLIDYRKSLEITDLLLQILKVHLCMNEVH